MKAALVAVRVHSYYVAPSKIDCFLQASCICKNYIINESYYNWLHARNHCNRNNVVFGDKRIKMKYSQICIVVTSKVLSLSIPRGITSYMHSQLVS